MKGHVNGFDHRAHQPPPTLSSLTQDSTPADIRAVLVTIGVGDPLAAEHTLREIKQRTGQPISVLRSALKSARRLPMPSNRPAWCSSIIVGSDGEPAPIAANVETALRNDVLWQKVLAFDEFHQRPMLMKKPPWANAKWRGPQPFADADEARTLIWVQRQGIHVRIEAVRQALSVVIDDHRFHPVRDYLDALVWDETPRLDKWLTYYLGVEEIDNYTASVGARWMISAVARIYEPGCMAKYALILEGPQDLKKSAALEVLGSPWFTDDVDELGSKDSKLQVGNAWIVELAELDSLKRAHINTIKAFISRKADRFRRPFGRYVIEQPRQCILSGTVNPSAEYLGDDTGAVRFWPVICISIDLDALRTDRDQLWAEAVSRYRAGEKWWLDDIATIAAAADEQEARYSADSWEQNITRWLSNNPNIEKITISEILTSVFEIPPSEHDRGKQTRVGSVLRRLRWSRPKQTRGDDGKRGRWYERPPALNTVTTLPF
jgi:putative DNA primase/helicase